MDHKAKFAQHSNVDNGASMGLAAPGANGVPLAQNTQDSTGQFISRDTKATSDRAATASDTIISKGDMWQGHQSARHANSPPPSSVKAGSFTVQSKMPTLPTVECDYRIPLGSDGRPQATAADIVLLFPYPTEKAAILGMGKALTEKHGFTTISIRFPGMGPSDGIDSDDHSKWYYWPESGSGDAWIDAINQIRKIGGFPERSVFVTGRSGGGSAAGLFANAYPNKVASVANEAGRVFSSPERFRGPILIMHGAHDYVAPSILEYVERERLAGNIVSRLTYPPTWDQRAISPIWQHGLHGPAEQAMWRWIVDVADMRLEIGSISSVQTWPVKYGQTPLPSSEVKKFMDQVTPVAQRYETSGTAVYIARPAAAKSPVGIVIISGCGQESTQDDLALDAEYFADQGWLALVACGVSEQRNVQAFRVHLTNSEFTSMHKLPWVLIADNPKNIKELIGVKGGGWLGIAVCNTHETTKQQISELQHDTSARLVIMSPPDKTFADIISSSNSTSLRLKALSTNGVGQWHLDRCVTIKDQISRWQMGKTNN